MKQSLLILTFVLLGISSSFGQENFKVGTNFPKDFQYKFEGVYFVMNNISNNKPIAYIASIKDHEISDDLYMMLDGRLTKLTFHESMSGEKFFDNNDFIVTNKNIEGTEKQYEGGASVKCILTIKNKSTKRVQKFTCMSFTVD